MKLATRSELTADEASRLAKLETVIAKGIQTFKQVGEALLEISDQRLYRATHSTFKDYVGEKWNMTAARAYQLCDAASVIKSLPEKSTMVDKINERQARELGKAPVTERPAVLEAAAKNGVVTAKTIKAEVQKRQPKPTPKPEPKPAKVIDVEPVEKSFSEKEEERLQAPGKSPARQIIEDLQNIIASLEALDEPTPFDDVQPTDFDDLANRLIIDAKWVRKIGEQSQG